MTKRNVLGSEEREVLLGYLDRQREGLRTAGYGLTGEEARSAPSASTLSVAGLIKHAAAVERNWAGLIRQEHQGADVEKHLASFRCGEIPLEELLADYARAAADTDAAVLAAETLDDPVPVPPGVPWFPKDIDAWTVRWVVLHLIEETARHSGHADIVRESIDGAQAVELVAAAEGRPPNDFVKPWRRATED